MPSERDRSAGGPDPADAATNEARGGRGEDLAAERLVDLGMTILDRRYRNKFGEVDIVAEDGETLVFVEVKSRTSGTTGGEPWEKVNPSKLRRICRVGEIYASERRMTDRPMRVDMIGITCDGDNVSITHYQDVTRFTEPPPH
ncbi:MAG: YraN family protein [Acidobacteriota bacterium]